ncbi:MAG: spermidine synthase [Sphingomonas sp.]|uniref:spermine/spermidine synthase domain-containing protein n=1 Tax=Sphingomonas sp. TaxID=28214 RepID=UPI0035629F16
MPESAERKIQDRQLDSRDWASGGDPDASAYVVDDLIAGDRMLESLDMWRERARRGQVESRPPYISDIGDIRSLHFDWHSMQSEMNVLDPIELTIDYTKMMMGFLLFDPSPRRIEMIGLGGGSLAKLCHHLLPETDITVVEINPRIIALRDEFQIPRDDDRFRILAGDGADFVAQGGSRPDVLLIDGFDEFGQPPQLCSSDFYDQCYRRLATGGMMIVNLWGGGNLNRGYATKIAQSFNGSARSVPTEAGFNQAVFARKDTRLALAQADIAATKALFPQHQAAFLPEIGRRIIQQLHDHTWRTKVRLIEDRLRRDGVE